MTVSFNRSVQGRWNSDGAENGRSSFEALLGFSSLLYRGGVAARNRLYDFGLLRQAKLPCSVISVGNLTVGGTGKTPTVIYLAGLLRERGRRPAILSRGYGGRAGGPVNVVSDGNRIRMAWGEAGDEPVLIARALSGVPVLTGARRRLTGRAAVDRFGADVLILDDAFQHRSLFRNLDVVLMDAAKPFGNGRLLPAGPLREPAASLRRAHLIIRTGSEGEAFEPDPHTAPDLPFFRGIRRPLGIVEGQTGRLFPADSLHGAKVCAFAGIARPESFRRSLTALGAEVLSFMPFPDHHPYTRPDVIALMRLAKEKGADRIVTTEKDGIRLADFPDFLADLSVLRIGMEVTPPGPFAELIFSRLAY